MKFSSEKIINYTEDEVLRKTDEYSIYRFYLGEDFKIGGVLHSPFHRDENPSFGIYRSSSTRALLFKDLSTGDTGNCFAFVAKLHGCNYNEAIQLVYKEMIKSWTLTTPKRIFEQPEEFIEIEKRISLTTRPYSKIALDYWKDYYITPEILDKYFVKSVKIVWVNGEKQLYGNDKNLIFGYLIYNRIKVYSPLASKANKWRSDCQAKHIQGYQQLPKTGDLLIITKSLKDVMALDNFKYLAIAPQSEHTSMPTKAIVDINKRFKKKIILFDNDSPGIAASNKLAKETKWNQIFIPTSSGCKDFSDFIKKYGEEEGIKFLIENNEISRRKN